MDAKPAALISLVTFRQNRRSYSDLSTRFPQLNPKDIYRSETPLFALLIGINGYKSESLAKLRGSTTDAAEFAEYLKDHLAVPASHVRLLLDEQASRSAIIDAFVSIRDDPRIKQGDAIFVFYAGHGGEAEAPTGWEAGGKGAKIQMLMPQNFSTEPGNEVTGIPDYTVAALLNQIAKEKGDNIVCLYTEYAFPEADRVCADCGL